VVLRRVDVILPRKEEVEKMDMKEGLAFEEAIDKILEVLSFCHHHSTHANRLPCRKWDGKNWR